MRAPGQRFNGFISKTFVCTKIWLSFKKATKTNSNAIGNMTQIKFSKQKFIRLKICTCQYKDSMTVYKCDNNNPDVKEKTVQQGLEMWTASVGRLGRGIVGNYCYDCVCMHVSASLRIPHCAGRCLYGIEALGTQTWRSPHGSGASSRLAQKTALVFSEQYSVCESLYQVAACSIGLAARRILESICGSQELYSHSWWNKGFLHLPIRLRRGKSL